MGYNSSSWQRLAGTDPYMAGRGGGAHIRGKGNKETKGGWKDKTRSRMRLTSGRASSNSYSR